MMDVSRKYGEKMGAMGTVKAMSAEGAAFSRKTAEMMSSPSMTPEHVKSMFSSMRNKASNAKMSERDLGIFDKMESQIWDQLPGAVDRTAPAKQAFSTDRAELMKQATKIGLL